MDGNGFGAHHTIRERWPWCYCRPQTLCCSWTQGLSLSLSLSLYMYIHTHTHACPSMYELNRASGCLKLKVIVVDNNSEFIYLIMLLYCFLHSHIIWGIQYILVYNYTFKYEWQTFIKHKEIWITTSSKQNTS